MNLKSLHKIIHSLSDEERKFIRKSLTLYRGKKSKYLILFDSLSAENICSEQFEAKLRSKYFPRYDQVYRAKEIVLSKVVKTLADLKEPSRSQLGFIKTAFHLEAFELAEKTLISEMESAGSSGNSLYLMKLHQYASELLDLYRIKIEIPSSVLGLKEIIGGHNISIEADSILREIRATLSSTIIERKRVARSIASRLQEFQNSWCPDPIKLKRLKVRNLILGMEYELAREFQEGFVSELIQEKENFPIVLKESELLMRLSLNTGQDELGRHTFFTLCQLEPPTLLDWRLKKRSEIRNGIFLASFTSDENRTQASWELLMDLRHVFPVPKLINLIYSSAYIFFSQGAFDRASLALDTLEDFKRPELSHLSWQIGLMRVMLYYEMQKMDLLEIEIRGAERLAKISELKLPLLAIGALKSSHSKGKMTDQLIDNHLKKWYEFASSPEEKRASIFFNLEAWLISKKKKTSMANIEIEMHRHERQESIDLLA